MSNSITATAKPRTSLSTPAALRPNTTWPLNWAWPPRTKLSAVNVMLLAPTPPRRWWRPSGTPTFKFPLTLTLKHPQHLTQNPTLLPYIPKLPFHTKYLPEALLLKRKHRAKKHERYNETKANAQIVLCHTCIMLKIQNSKTTPYKNHQKIFAQFC